MSSSSSRLIVLESSDGETFEMDEAEAQLSTLIKSMIEADCAKTCIPIPKVTGNILSRIIYYCRNHVNTTADDNDALTSFDKKFVDVDDATLLHLANAAIFLEIKSLITLTCQTLAGLIKDKSVEEIRARFRIKNDFTEEEKAEIRRENTWAFTPSVGEIECAFNETSSTD